MPHSRPDFLVYQDSLFHLGHGFPLWKPDPGSNGEIELGDIGYCEAGRFHRVHHLNVEEICGITVPEPENNPFPEPLKYKVTKDSKKSAGLGVHPPFSPVKASGKVSAEHTYDEEATLSLKNRNALVSCLTKQERAILERYIINHYKDWLKFGDMSIEDIIVVTGTYKTGDWNARVCTKWSRNFSAQGGLEGGELFEASAGVERDEWESRSPGYNRGHLHQDTRIGEAHDLTDFPECGQNLCLPPAQCIFLHTCRVRRRVRVVGRALAQIITQADEVTTRFKSLKLVKDEPSNKPPPPSNKPLPPLPGSSQGSSGTENIEPSPPGFGNIAQVSVEKIQTDSDCEAFYDTIAYQKFQENPTLEAVVVSDEEVIQYFNFGRGPDMENYPPNIRSNAFEYNPRTIEDSSTVGGAQVSAENIQLIDSDSEAFYDTMAYQKFEENPTLEVVVVSDEEVNQYFKFSSDPLVETSSDLIAESSFSPDRTHIASGSHDQTIRVWDTATRQQVGGPDPERSYISLPSFNVTDETFSDSEIYCNELLRLKRGFPLYVPGPPGHLPAEYRRHGVAIGDVGRVTPEGKFDFFFNIYLPADHPINGNFVPQNFCPLTPYTLRDVFYLDYEPGNYVSTSSIHKLDLDSPLDEFPGGDFIFICEAPEGTVLALPHGAHLKKLENLDTVRRYAAMHAEDWYKYVNGPRGRGLANGSLYLVTGCEKAPSWGMASFKSAGDEFQLAFQPIARADSPVQYRWSRRNPARTKSYNPSRIDGGPLNQTTFIHGLSISLATGIWGRLLGTVEIRDIVESQLGSANHP